MRPVFATNCYKCHGPDKQNGELRLDSRAAILTGGESGPAIVPGKPDESLLIRAVSYLSDGPQMPPKEKGGKLSEEGRAKIVAALKKRWAVHRKAGK